MKMNQKLAQSLGIAMIGLTCASPLFPGAARPEKKPNILFIAVDDLKPVLGCYGSPLIKTPNIDRLARKGTIFTHSYCQQAVCGPTRASLLTGLRPDHTKVWDLKTRMRDVNPEILTLPEYLISQGYSTQGLGKIYDPRCVDENLDKPSWSVPFYKNLDEYYSKETGKPSLNYQMQETKNKIAGYQKEAEEKGIEKTRIPEYIARFVKPSVECVDVADNAYDDGACARKAEDLLSRLSKKKEPFFLAVGFAKPHLPFVAPKKYWDMYNRKDMPVAEFQKQALNSPPVAYHQVSELRQYSDIPPLAEFSDQKPGISLPLEKQKELIHGYYASVSYTDAQIGLLLNALDSLGLADNTIIVLWGDHGWHLGDHNLWCKHTNFEQATRAPLIISAPGVRPAAVDSPVEFVDIFPTLCDLSGLPVPQKLDGVSLAEMMKNPASKTKKEFAVSQYPRSSYTIETGRLGFTDGKCMGYSIRTGRFRYTVWMKDDFRSTDAFNKEMLIADELYDYKKDPLETVNHSKEKKYSKIVKEMYSKMLGFLSSQSRKNDTSVVITDPREDNGVDNEYFKAEYCSLDNDQKDAKDIGKRIIVALNNVKIESGGRIIHLSRGGTAVFQKDEPVKIISGKYYAVSLKTNHPPLTKPEQWIEPLKNTSVYEDNQFRVFQERLNPGDTRERHSHTHRIVVRLNEVQLTDPTIFPDGTPGTGIQVPNTVRYAGPVVHTVKNLSREVPLLNIVIEYKYGN